MSKRERMAERQRLLLEILVKAGAPMHRNEVMEKLEQLQPPLPEELGYYKTHPSSTKYRVSTHFFNIAQVRAGWIVKEQGMWSATADGAEALTKYPDASSFSAASTAAYRAWKALRDQEIDPTKSDQLGDEQSQSLVALSIEIRNHLANQSWQSFQDLVAHLLRAMGWHVVYKADDGADRGLDIVAYEDPLGAKGTRIKVQVKRYSETAVAADVVERTASKINDGETGVIVTLSSFTKEARLSARDSKDRITLIDGNRLIELWSKYYDHIPEEGRALLRLRFVPYLNLD
jgi:restriction system protein